MKAVTCEMQVELIKMYEHLCSHRSYLYNYLTYRTEATYPIPQHVCMWAIGRNGALPNKLVQRCVAG